MAAGSFSFSGLSKGFRPSRALGSGLPKVSFLPHAPPRKANGHDRVGGGAYPVACVAREGRPRRCLQGTAVIITRQY